MILISIIIPVYNAYRNLKINLENIRFQSYRNFECILIDDGSTDGGPELLDNYEKLDSRFKVIHKLNEGVGAARNKGLEIAKGDFITFVDSDDEISQFYLEHLLNKIADNDILISGFTVRSLEQWKKIGTTSGKATVNKFALAIKEGTLNSCWAKLYNREVVKNIRFSEQISWGEDTAFLLSCLCKTNKVAFDASHEYVYTFSTIGLANRFDKRKPIYLSVYYKYLLAFWEHWSGKQDELYDAISIKISQEILNTINALVDNVLDSSDQKLYIKTLFTDKKINELFMNGVSLDDNPFILRVFSRFPNEIIWSRYVKLRRIIKKIKR